MMDDQLADQRLLEESEFDTLYQRVSILQSENAALRARLLDALERAQGLEEERDELQISLRNRTRLVDLERDENAAMRSTLAHLWRKRNMMMNCTRCEGTGFINTSGIPELLWNTAEPEDILIWIQSQANTTDASVCDCCGNGGEWYDEPGQHNPNNYGKGGPYAYNGGLPECY